METPEPSLEFVQLNDAMLLDTRTAARRLSICTKTLKRLCDDGEIRCVWIGSRRRVSVIELRAFIRRREQESERNR